MDIVAFIIQQWQLLISTPAPFLTLSAICLGVGFAVGKLFYGTVASIAKERLEAARDDLARLEKRKADDIQDASFLRAEIAALRADLDRRPNIPVGTSPPGNAMGKDGDIYIQVAAEPETRRVPSSEMFLRDPLTSVTAALTQAATTGLPVFLVIYDPSHPTHSKLSYSLGYFLEYQTTRRLVDQHFVAALVPSTDEFAKKFVPEDDPLENCRWVVLGPNGQVLRSEGLYANPDEGLKRTREAIRWAESCCAKG